MASSDPHTGGKLEDMAVEGTTMPNDAGKMNIIPSVPRPDQRSEDPNFSAEGLGAADISGAADNATDIPRSNRDLGHGVTSETVTGTDDSLPAEAESKRLHFGANNPLAKGHDRTEKHAKQKESDFDRYAAASHEMEPPPSEEEEGQDVIRSRHEGRETG